MSRARRAQPDRVNFRCPGCNEVHSISDAPGRWTFNGNFDSPTFSPSVLVMCGHYAPHWKQGDNCWCTFDAEQREKGDEPSGFACYRCHSFVTDGRIQFLGDCTHSLAGQTVDLPEWESTP